VESEPGKGTTFRFVIPYKLAGREINHPALPVDMSPVQEGFQNVHILVVDDNAMNQSLLKHLLTEWKFSFDEVNNGIEALKKLKETRYDIVLMDIQMPGMDGYSATQEIRRNLKLDIPIIAMTAHAFAGEREKCLNYGMNEYIAKPINDTELYRLITQFTSDIASNDKFKKKEILETPAGYNVINLLYMRDVSNDNKEYEKTVTEQFIEAIPIDIATLESAFTNRDETTLRQTAHNMKTNVSVMGLLEKLLPYLDELEYEPFDNDRFQQTILSIKRVCMDALPEARHFYTTLQAG
jgi:CheY-like chemotaxis protein